MGAPVFVHPWDLPDSPRLRRWMAQWLVGMPAETHLSILAMVLGGVFDRVDRSLRICFAHGGGSFPAWVGRMDNAWHSATRRHRHFGDPPSHYVDRFSVDSVVFDEAALRLLVDTMGPTQVVVGSDYPYPFGERPAGGVVRSAAFLDEPTRTAILSGNARRFLGPVLSSGVRRGPCRIPRARARRRGRRALPARPNSSSRPPSGGPYPESAYLAGNSLGLQAREIRERLDEVLRRVARRGPSRGTPRRSGLG